MWEEEREGKSGSGSGSGGELLLGTGELSGGGGAEAAVMMEGLRRHLRRGLKAVGVGGDKCHDSLPGLRKCPGLFTL